MTLFDLLLAILCAYRLTQLLTWDDLLSPVTCWLANKHRLLDELFGCPHCMGFWCSLVTVVAVTQGHWLIRMGVWAFAVSGAVSMIQHATGWLDTEIPELPKDPPSGHDKEPAAYSGLSDDTIVRLVKADGHLAGPVPCSGIPLSTAEIIRLGEADGYAYKGGRGEPKGEEE